MEGHDGRVEPLARGDERRHLEEGPREDERGDASARAVVGRGSRPPPRRPGASARRAPIRRGGPGRPAAAAASGCRAPRGGRPRGRRRRRAPPATARAAAASARKRRPRRGRRPRPPGTRARSAWRGGAARRGGGRRRTTVARGATSATGREAPRPRARATRAAPAAARATRTGPAVSPVPRGSWTIHAGSARPSAATSPPSEGRRPRKRSVEARRAGGAARTGLDPGEGQADEQREDRGDDEVDGEEEGEAERGEAHAFPLRRAGALLLPHEARQLRQEGAVVLAHRVHQRGEDRPRRPAAEQAVEPAAQGARGEGLAARPGRVAERPPVPLPLQEALLVQPVERRHDRGVGERRRRGRAAPRGPRGPAGTATGSPARAPRGDRGPSRRVSHQKRTPSETTPVRPGARTARLSGLTRYASSRRLRPSTLISAGPRRIPAAASRSA